MRTDAEAKRKSSYTKTRLAQSIRIVHTLGLSSRAQAGRSLWRILGCDTVNVFSSKSSSLPFLVRRFTRVTSGLGWLNISLVDLKEPRKVNYFYLLLSSRRRRCHHHNIFSVTCIFFTVVTRGLMSSNNISLAYCLQYLFTRYCIDITCYCIINSHINSDENQQRRTKRRNVIEYRK